jgi:hypothetical protein
MRNDAIGREVPWQISPSAPVSIEIENGVEDFPPRIFDFATQLFGTTIYLMLFKEPKQGVLCQAVRVLPMKFHNIALVPFTNLDGNEIGSLLHYPHFRMIFFYRL